MFLYVEIIVKTKTSVLTNHSIGQY